MYPITKTILTFIAMILLFYTEQANAQQITAKGILEKMELQMKGNSMYAEMSMTTVRPRYSREVTMKTWLKGDDYSMILISSPARDKGITYLKRGKEIWNYVPNIDRLIKLPPSMMSQSWMGSDFSNDDLVRESSSINDFNHRIVDTVKYQGFDCWILELIPKASSSVVYGKVKIWVSRTTFLQLRTENYDEKGVLVSTLLASEIKYMGGRTIPTKIEIIPSDKKNQKTILRYIDVKFNTPINDGFFSVQNMKNLR